MSIKDCFEKTNGLYEDYETAYLYNYKKWPTIKLSDLAIGVILHKFESEGKYIVIINITKDNVRDTLKIIENIENFNEYCENFIPDEINKCEIFYYKWSVNNWRKLERNVNKKGVIKYKMGEKNIDYPRRALIN